MKTIISVLVFVLAAGVVVADPPPPPAGGHWEVMPLLTDEFNGSGLDTSKWYNGCTYWTGRTPSQFVAENVAVSNGFLMIRQTTTVTNMAQVPDPNHTNWIKTACVTSKTKAADPYCYYESSIKVARLVMANSFWFQGSHTEIDVIENFGDGADSRTNLMMMNTHHIVAGVDTPENMNWTMPYSSASDFHAYGVWWAETNSVRFYHNGTNVATVVPGGPLDEKQYMFFDAEAFYRIGLPSLEGLWDPLRNTMYIDWVHSWRLVPDSDIAVGVTDSQDPGVAGTPFNYTLSITNIGPLSAADVTVADTLPVDVTFVSASASQGSAILSGSMVWIQLGAMASNACATVQITVVPNKGGVFTNGVCVKSPAEWGLYSSNNTASTVTTVLSLQKLEVSPALLDFGYVRTGATVQARFTVTNSGDFALTGTAVGESSQFVVVSGSPYTVVARSATNVVVSFTAPVAAATYDGNVVFASNGGNSTNAATAMVSSDSPTACFTGSPTNGSAPLTVTFTDISSGSITNRAWDFGDGATLSTNLATVQHTYVAAGGKTVTLTVSGPVGFSSQTRSNYVNVVVPAPATWTNASASGHWSGADNWAPTVVPDYGGNVIFGTGGGTSVVDAVSRTVGGVIFNRAGNFIVVSSGGAGLTVNRGIAVSNSYTCAINVPVTLGSTNTWFVNTGGILQAGGPVGGTGPLTKTGAGTVTLTGTNACSGAMTLSAGTLVVNGGVVSNIVTFGTVAGASLVVTNGGKVSGVISLGNSGNNQSVIIDGANSVLNNNGAEIRLGTSGTGTRLQVSNSGILTNVGQIWISYSAHNNGMIITNGGQVFATKLWLGHTTTQPTTRYTNCWAYVGSSTTTASVLNVKAGDLLIGGTSSDGYDWLKVDQGGIATNVGAIAVGSASNAVGNYMVITNGGRVFSKSASSIGKCTTSVVGIGGISNTVSIGSSTPTKALWDLGAMELTLGGYTNSIGNNLAVDTGGVLTNGSVTLAGARSVFFLGGDAYLSTVTLSSNDSKLVLNNGRLTAAVTVASGGTLAGTGVIKGPVILNGTLAPGNSVGTLTISNSLTCGGSAVLQYQLGASNDLTVVTGGLTLGGTLNIADAGGFAIGTNTLFTYPAGQLTDNGLTIGTVPHAGYTYTLDTSVAGQVRLVVRPTTFSSWITAFPGAGAWDDDPDEDGNVNLMEYALGNDPRVKDRGGVSVMGPTAGVLTLTYTRRLPIRDITYWIEVCTNLVAGNWISNGMSEVQTTDDGNGLTETVTVQDGVALSNAATRFFRLKVNQPK